jgi:hypothetical protein
MQANARFMKLVDDLLRPESLPRGWTASFDAVKGEWCAALLQEAGQPSLQLSAVCWVCCYMTVTFNIVAGAGQPSLHLSESS